MHQGVGEVCTVHRARCCCRWINKGVPALACDSWSQNTHITPGALNCILLRDDTCMFPDVAPRLNPMWHVFLYRSLPEGLADTACPHPMLYPWSPRWITRCDFLFLLWAYSPVCVLRAPTDVKVCRCKSLLRISGLSVHVKELIWEAAFMWH
jgi:hypothetical protein